MASKRQTTPIVPAEKARERRHSFRVEVPCGFLREIALWFTPEPPRGSIISLEDLGMPHYVTLGDVHRISLEDVSARGLGVSFDIAQLSVPEELRDRHLYVYIKLQAPVIAREASVYSLFFGMKIVHVKRAGNRMHLGLSILTRGMPVRRTKALRLFDVERFGVRELTRWCDDIARLGRGMACPPVPELSMDMLLSELALQASTGTVESPKR